MKNILLSISVLFMFLTSCTLDVTHPEPEGVVKYEGHTDKNTKVYIDLKGNLIVGYSIQVSGELNDYKVEKTFKDTNMVGYAFKAKNQIFINLSENDPFMSYVTGDVVNNQIIGEYQIAELNEVLNKYFIVAKGTFKLSQKK
ncbi:translation initiation factor eIF-2B [Flammeovirga kamogawensis]|uniref:Translation initiation factor eIF-2B n=1 Tax=Flammeovirga kamogawensis TaxID=373891 RepID=A0ABX8GZ50_9BACT|nr:translation initiation factor eIF-2B [Flammeovirga kamogawensis]MBB6459120.1 hypothetical protein [Flammeovirga kamogawensis]QWG08689.1 translation initiation factor eIF-2B [Flammeovirga kamogawensis]TRX66982.1 translation initiation factor eIF-2B [Flammeovirga kamogawensis]